VVVSSKLVLHPMGKYETPKGIPIIRWNSAMSATAGICLIARLIVVDEGAVLLLLVVVVVVVVDVWFRLCFVSDNADRSGGVCDDGCGGILHESNSV